jgi:hypothetical protein
MNLSLLRATRIDGRFLTAGSKASTTSQVQGHARVGRNQAGVGHAEFYVTAAIVMPVLFAIVLFQTRALNPANLRQGRGRVNTTLAQILMQLVVLFPLYAEGTTIYALYLNEDSHGQRLVAFIGVTELLVILMAVVVGHVLGAKTLKP